MYSQVFFLPALVAALVAFGTAHAQNAVDVGSCTPGDLKCAADTVVLVCECFDRWHEIDGAKELLTVCLWEDTGERCGQPPAPVQPPPCNESYDGATFEFIDEVKVCSCSDETGCRWVKNY